METTENVGRKIGGFRVISEIGHGGMAFVYKAVCEKPMKDVSVKAGEIVALKVMSNGQDEKLSQWKRLQDRTQELMRLKHPNIVRYYGCFRSSGGIHENYIVAQEFLDGESLKDRLARRHYGLDMDEGLMIAKAVADALVHANAIGIVHRDIKPANIFLCLDGEGKITGVKLIDFEIAKQEDASMSTNTGLHGTFAYMAPDFIAEPSFRGDAQSDVFSMGVVLHEIFTGRLPYRDFMEGGTQLQSAWLNRWYRALKDGEEPFNISSRFRMFLENADGVLESALSVDRAGRYGDFTALRAALEKISPRRLSNGRKSYRLQQYIGKGGFGEVWKARDEQNGDAEVAIKSLFNNDYLRRFDKERDVLQKLADSEGRFVRFVDSFKVDVPEGGTRAYLVMQYLPDMPGSSLRDAIKRAKAEKERLPFEDVIRAFSRYASGLHIMHTYGGCGIIHRDIKPSNLYFPTGHPERAAIMDFGIVKDLGGDGTTTEGFLPGTYDYMPPEVVTDSSRGDAGMDIYALGLSLYEAITCKTAYPRLPSDGSSFIAFVTRAQSRTPPNFDKRDPAIRGHSDLLLLLRGMTNLDPRKRINDASQVAEKLNELLGTDAPTIDPNPHSPKKGDRPTEPVRTPRVPPEKPKPRRWLFRIAVSVLSVAVLVLAGVAVNKVYPDVLRPILDVFSPKGYAEFRVGKDEVCRFSRNGKASSTVMKDGDLISLVAGRRYECEFENTAREGDVPKYNPQRQTVSFSVSKDSNTVVGAAEWKLNPALPKPVGYAEFVVQAGEICRFDGKERRKGEKVTLAEGVYECAFERTNEVNGVREWLPQTNSFTVSAVKKVIVKAIEEKWRPPSLPDPMPNNDDFDWSKIRNKTDVANHYRELLASKPVTNRRGRLAEAKPFVEECVKRGVIDFMEGAELYKKEDIELRTNLVVGAISNGCPYAINIIGGVATNSVKPGGYEVFEFTNNVPKPWLAMRDERHEAKPLEHEFDGKELSVADSDFPLRTFVVHIPKLEDGVTCSVDDKPVSGSFRAPPGTTNIYIYRREGFLFQSGKYGVKEDDDQYLPPPGEWIPEQDHTGEVRFEPGKGVVCTFGGVVYPTNAVRKLKPGRYVCVFENLEKNGAGGSKYHSQTNSFTVVEKKVVRVFPSGKWVPLPIWRETDETGFLDEKVAATNLFWRQIEELEPVTNRQTRLDEAWNLLPSKLFSEKELGVFRQEYLNRRYWIVGAISNGCTDVITVHTNNIMPGTSKVLKYATRVLPYPWVAKRKGYEPKALNPDFDGRVLSLEDKDFIPIKVSGTVRFQVDKGTRCIFDGKKVDSQSVSKLKAGDYECVYENLEKNEEDGSPMYYSQTNSFSVIANMSITVSASPSWTITSHTKDLWTNKFWRLVRQLEPVTERRARLGDATALIIAGGNKGVFATDEVRALNLEVRERDLWIVGVISNGCTDVVTVPTDVVTVATINIMPGAAEVLTFKNGRLPVPWEAIRKGKGKGKGYYPKQLDPNFEGAVLRLFDGDFAPVPPPDDPTDRFGSVRFLFDKGVRCIFNGREVDSQSDRRLKVGDYECVFENRRENSAGRPWYYSHTNSFSVVADKTASVRDWRTWIQTDDTKNLIRDEVERKRIAATNWFWTLVRALEPVAERKKRLDEAEKVLRKATQKDDATQSALIDAVEAMKLNSALDKNRNGSVGKVSNGCSDVVKIGGREVKPGESNVLVFMSGLSGSLDDSNGHHADFIPMLSGSLDDSNVKREGHVLVKPLGRFDGLELTLRDSDFTERPRPEGAVHFELKDGVKCVFDGKEVNSRADVKLNVGEYECTYENLEKNSEDGSPKYEKEIVRFTIEENMIRPVLAPADWRKTKYTVELEEARRVAATNEFWTLVRVLEPVAERRKRLAAAKDVIEKKGESMGGSLKDDLSEELRKRSWWIVGAISNGCSDTIEVVADSARTPIEPGGHKVFSFESGRVPDVWKVERKGHEPKRLPSFGFDGRELSFADSDFELSKVEVRIPELPDGITCRVDGRIAADSVRKRPGDALKYSYERRWHKYIGKTEYAVTEEKEQTLPPPTSSDWRKSEVRVRVPSMIGVTCFVDGKAVRDALLIEHGRRLNCVYMQDGYRNVEKTYDVKPADDQVLDMPEPHDWILLKVPVKLQTPVGVECKVDGVAVSGNEVMLVPGPHTCEYSRVDYMPQSVDFQVNDGKASAVPPPGKWTPTEGLRNLNEAEEIAKMENEGWRDKVRELLKNVNVSSRENLDREETLRNKISSWKEIEDMLENANFYYDSGMYDKYFELCAKIKDKDKQHKFSGVEITNAFNRFVLINREKWTNSIFRTDSHYNAKQLDEELEHVKDLRDKVIK